MFDPAQRIPIITPRGSLGFFPRTHAPISWQEGLEGLGPLSGASSDPVLPVRLDVLSLAGRWGTNIHRLDICAERPPNDVASYLLALLADVAPDIVRTTSAFSLSPDPFGRTVYSEGSWRYERSRRGD